MTRGRAKTRGAGNASEGTRSTSAAGIAAPTWIRGDDLKVGDTIAVWWSPGRDVITALRPYTGSLAHLFAEGAQIASFALCRSGMTIDNGDVYARIASGAGS